MSTAVMLERMAEASLRFKARIAGVFYLLTFVTGIFALMSVNGGLVTNIAATACYVAVILLFYHLFKAVNRRYRSGRPIFQRQFLGPPTASGSQTRRVLVPMSMTCKEPPSYDISIHALKYTLATLIQGVASALRHQLFEHASHGFYSIHQMIQLRKLSLRERSPAFRRASDIAEAKEQMSDFTQGKTELTRTLNDCQPLERSGVVSSLPAHSRGPGEAVQFSRNTELPMLGVQLVAPPRKSSSRT
jgi:hypothetical protein